MDCLVSKWASDVGRRLFLLCDLCHSEENSVYETHERLHAFALKTGTVYYKGLRLR